MITNEHEIGFELKKNLGKTCMLDIYKEDSFSCDFIGKLIDSENCFTIKNCDFQIKSISSIEYVGQLLRIKIRL